MGPAVDALATRCRVITASLPDDVLGKDGSDDPHGFDSFIRWVDGLLDGLTLKRVALCGISYGGLVALHYAAERPQRVTSLTLASTPAPAWRPNCRVEWYLKAPRLLSLVFALSSPVRLYPEIAAAFPNLLARTGFALRHLHCVARYPFTPTRMADRVRRLNGVDFEGNCRRVHAPTQVVTGEPELDRVVPVEDSRAYVRTIAGAVYVQLKGTGHIGLATKPDRFADVVGSFVTAHACKRGQEVSST